MTESALESQGPVAGLPALQAVQQERFAQVARSGKAHWARVVSLPLDLSAHRAFAFGYVPGQGLTTDPSPSGGVGLTLVRDRLEIDSREQYTWIGSVQADGHKVGYALFVYRKGEGVTGTLGIRGEQYALRNLTGGRYALVRLDEKAVARSGNSPIESGDTDRFSDAFEAAPTPSHDAKWAEEVRFQEAPDADMRTLPATIPPGESAGGGRCSSVNTQRVLVVYDPASAQGRDLSGEVALAVAQANLSYSNSQVSNLRMELAGVVPTNYRVNSNPDVFRRKSERARIASDPQVTSLRSQYKADIVIMIDDLPDPAGGRL
jgi:hypothetical protein